MVSKISSHDEFSELKQCAWLFRPNAASSRRASRCPCRRSHAVQQDPSQTCLHKQLYCLR